jgi:PAS domain S-box-containing protein
MESPEQNGHSQKEQAIFFQSIIDNVPDMIFVKEAKELRFVLFNKAGEELVGYPKKDMIGKNDYDFFPESEADFFVTNDRLVLTKKELLDIPEESLQTHHKGLRILHTKKIPILDENGVPQYLLGISEDITEKKEAQNVLMRTYEDLEEKIHERTKELEEVASELKKEIEKRKAIEDSLMRKNYELELSNKAMMEGEGKIADLKSNIEMLEKKARG